MWNSAHTDCSTQQTYEGQTRHGAPDGIQYTHTILYIRNTREGNCSLYTATQHKPDEHLFLSTHRFLSACQHLVTKTLDHKRCVIRKTVKNETCSCCQSCSHLYCINKYPCKLTSDHVQKHLTWQMNVWSRMNIWPCGLIKIWQIMIRN